MAKAAPPKQPLPCDNCKAKNAPFGFVVPEGRQSRAGGRRTLWACVDPACRAWAQTRWEKARAAFLRKSRI